jgi:membrane-bound metal-dependent hydrolase YbcI (DUF457 family)
VDELPFTPFHIGPMFLLYELFPFFDPIGLVLGSVIPDVEAVGYYFFRIGDRLHGPHHSLLGGSISAFETFLISRLIWRIYARSELQLPLKLQIPSRSMTVLASLVGGYSHIFLDAFLYGDMNLIWPWSYSNPLLGLISHSGIYTFCVLCFIFGLLCFLLRTYRNKD